jgi:hypothetical protein
MAFFIAATSSVTFFFFAAASSTTFFTAPHHPLSSSMRLHPQPLSLQQPLLPPLRHLQPRYRQTPPGAITCITTNESGRGAIATSEVSPAADPPLSVALLRLYNGTSSLVDTS